MAGMRAKLGLFTEAAADKDLVRALLATMHATGADFTDTFRQLAMVPMPPPLSDASGATGGHRIYRV